MTTIMRHAYFSQQQKDMILRKPRSRDMDNTPHTNIYLTVDGREVEVTEVIKTKPNHHQKKLFRFTISRNGNKMAKSEILIN